MYIRNIFIVLVVSLFSLPCFAEVPAGIIQNCHGCSVAQYNSKLADFTTDRETYVTILDFPNNYVETFITICLDSGNIQRNASVSASSSRSRIGQYCRNKRITPAGPPQYVRDIFDAYRGIWEETGGTFKVEVVIDASNIRVEGSNINLDQHPMLVDGAFSTASNPNARYIVSRGLIARFQSSITSGQPAREVGSVWRALYNREIHRGSVGLNTLISAIHGAIQTITSLEGNIVYRVKWPNGTISSFRAGILLDKFEAQSEEDSSGNKIPTLSEIRDGMLGWQFMFNSEDSAWAMVDYLRNFGLINPGFRRGNVSVGPITSITCMVRGEYVCTPVSPP